MAPRPIPTATPLNPPIGKISEVFLSATVADLDQVRLAVADALRLRARTAVYLQEEWNRGAGDTVLACLNVLQRSSGYLGIFGFRYGWIPNDCPRSITELEYGWALERWRAVDPPPIFIFLPQAGSEVEQELRDKAESTLALEYPKEIDENERARSMDLQAQFVKTIRAKNVILIFFSNVQDLKERAISSVLHWNIELLEQASRDRRLGATFMIPPAELGAIGRGQHLRALAATIEARDKRAEALALCAVVHGSADSGMSEFRMRLASWEGWDEVGHHIEPGRPPGDTYTLACLIMWTLEMLGSGKPGADASIDRLATAVGHRLEQGPVVLLLQDVDGLEGQLAAFHADFWCPLLAALQPRWRKSWHRMTMIVMTRVTPAPDSALIWGGGVRDADIDYRRLLLLPALGRLTLDHVQTWLESHRVPSSGPIAERSIGNGTPSEVYDALQRNGFWKLVVERGR